MALQCSLPLCCYLLICLDIGSRSGLELHKALMMPEYSHSVSPDKTAFNIAYDFSGTLFDFNNLKGNEHLRQRFDMAMQSRDPVFSVIYPWNSIKEGGVIVDVGGGVGHACLQLSKVFGNLKFIVQDQPGTIEAAKKFWESNSPGSLKNGNIVLQSHNFFVENPVKQANIYFLRHVVNDWSDDKAIEILKNIQTSMGPNCKVLLLENVVLPPVRMPNTAAPWPLPGNKSSRYANHVDLHVLALFIGKSRTRSGFQHLFEKADLKLVEVFQSGEECADSVIVGMSANT